MNHAHEIADPPDPPDTAEPQPNTVPLHEAEGGFVRIVVRTRRDTYDDLYQHVTERRTTMSAYARAAILEKMARDR